MAERPSIRIMCPNLACMRVLAVPDNARGRLVRCRGCATTIKIPDKKQEESPPEPSSEAPSS